MSLSRIYAFTMIGMLVSFTASSIAQNMAIEEWVARYDGPLGRGRAIALAVDTEGNVYVTGSSTGSGTAEDYATVKYSSEGEELWVARYDGPGGDDDYALALALDSDGNIYVTGSSEGSDLCSDYATVKYSPAGEELWVARYDGPGDGNDWGYALALDSDGNIYVTGSSGGLDTGEDYATVKYSSEGEELWVARYDRPGGGSAVANALAVDSEGNVYVTGAGTIKYNTEGEELWVREKGGEALSLDREENG